MSCRICLSGGCLALLVLSTSQADLPEESQKGTLTGRVATLDGQPVSGARVWLDADEEPLAETRSDADGRFRLGPLAPVYRYHHDLLMDADGLARQYVSGVSIFGGVENNLGEIVLTPGHRYAGQLLDIDGKPRANADVQITSYRFYLSQTVVKIGPPWELSTDANGHFNTPPLPVGDVIIEFRVPERRLAHVAKTVPPGSGEEMLDPVRLEKDEPIAGIVQDEKGQPVAGAEVHAYPNDVHTTTDAEGRFVLRSFGPNPNIQLKASKKGHVPYNKALKNAQNVTVSLPRAGWITGKAVDAETDQPVHLSNLTLCLFQRLADGTIIRQG